MGAQVLAYLRPIFATSIGLLLLSGDLAASASPSKKASPSSGETVYAVAKSQLPDDLYAPYRLLDRIISANPEISQSASIGIRSLDGSTCKAMVGESGLCSIAAQIPDVGKQDSFLIWALQVAGASYGNPNAYAYSNSNRIILNKPLDDTLGGDIEAKACVIAHEMAHIQLDHTKKLNEAKSALNETASAKIRSAVRNAHNAQNGDKIWAALATGLNAGLGSFSAGMGNYAAAASAYSSNEQFMASIQADGIAGGPALAQVLQTASGQAPSVFNALQGMEGLSASYVKRTMKDVNAYLQEVNTQADEISRSHEVEADQTAVAYLSRAGINPEGCIRILSKLTDGKYVPSSKNEGTHPNHDERLARVQEAINSNANIYRRAKSQLIKPAPLQFRYDPRVELVTVYPKNQTPGPSAVSPSKTIDSILK